MKKPLYILIMCMVIGLALSCEKDVYDINPQMEAYYVESKQLTTVTVDSVQTFSNKVDRFTNQYPWAVEHQRYPQIKENIRVALIRTTTQVDTTWNGVVKENYK